MNYFRAYLLFCFAFCLLFTLLVRRKSYREHRAFFCYIGYISLWQTVKIAVDCVHPIPVQTWWALYRIEEVAEQLLSAWVCVALLWEAFFPVIALSKRTMTLWLAAIPTLAVIAVLLPQLHPILTLDRVANWVMSGCFAIVVLQLGSPRVYIKSHSYGIGLGFLLLLVVGAVRSAIVTKPGQGDIAALLTSVSVCALWGGFFACKDLPCRPIFNRTPDPDGSRARHNLESLGESQIHVVDMGLGTSAQWNSQGIGSSFYVRAEQIQLPSSIRAMEAVKLAEFEQYEKKQSQSHQKSHKHAAA